MRHLTRSTIVAVTLASIIAGNAAPASAIVGGREASRPYDGVAAVQIVFPGLGTALCGGSLIHPQFVLLAAHCVSDQAAAPTPVAVPGANVTVRIGSTDRTTAGQVVIGRTVYLPPDWAWANNWPATPVSDYALIELAHPVQAPIMPLALRPAPDASTVRMVGWGLTAYPAPPDATPPAALQERDTTVLAATACAGGFIGAGELCLGPGACFGDSGSPALRKVRGSTLPAWASVGIASRESSTDDPCAEPSVYTDTSSRPFRLWVRNTIHSRRHEPCHCPRPGAAPNTASTRVNTLKPKIIK